MPSAPLLVAMAMPSRLPSLPFPAFLPLSFHPPGSVSLAVLTLPGCPAVLPRSPVFVVPLSPLALVGRHAASLPAFPVPVPVAPVAPVAVPLLPQLTLHIAQRCAAEATFHTGLCWKACLSTVRSSRFLMMMMVVAIVVGGSAVVVDILAPVLLVQRQLTRLGLVGVVVAVVLRVDHQWPVQVGLHITTSFPRVGHLGRVIG